MGSAVSAPPPPSFPQSGRISKQQLTMPRSLATRTPRDSEKTKKKKPDKPNEKSS